MLFAEPSRTAYDLYFSLFGVPVRVHPLFWLVAAILGSGAATGEHAGLRLLIWVLVVFVSIVVHEMGHALAIRFYGFQPWIVLYGFGGLAMYHPEGSYRARSRGGHGAIAQIVIALAGPFAGFLLAGLVIALALATSAWGAEALARVQESAAADVALDELFWSLLWVNIGWGIVNLLPIFPLDGGRVSRAVFTAFAPNRGMAWSLTLSVLAAGGMAALGAYIGSFYILIMFLFLAFSSWQALQSISTGYGDYGGSRDRPW